MAKSRFFIFVFLATIAISIKTIAAVKYRDQIHFQSKDGVRLEANLFYNEGAKNFWPAIVFVNSWSLEDHEYLLKAHELAQAGYNVFTYSARGWGGSQGQVEVISANDMKDVSAAVDWLISNTNSDPKKIGMAGISYGGGMALKATAFEPRIKAVASLSGWVNLSESLFPGQTTNELWTKILLYIGLPTGRLSEEVKTNILDANKYINVPHIIEWAKERSAETFIKQTNENGTPILIVNNWNDGLFNPNSILRYFSNLQTPKKLILAEGIHGTGEAGGLLGSTSNESWSAVQDWFDYWLKGEDNHVLESPKVTFAIHHTDEKDQFSDWPPTHLQQAKYFLAPGAEFFTGKMQDQEYNQKEIRSFWSGIDSGASTGIPVLGSFLDAHLDLAVSLFWQNLKQAHSFSFLTAATAKKLKIRGIGLLNLNLRSTELSQTVIAYIYDVNEWGQARLVTHGVKSFTQDTRFFKSNEIEFMATAYDVPAGHRIGLVIDSKDEIYKEINDENGVVDLKFTAGEQNALSLSIIP